MLKTALPLLVGWVPRIILTAALLAYAVLAWGSGIDRMANPSPLLKGLVPEQLLARTHIHTAAAALDRGETKAALHAASSAVRANPLEPLALSLLGYARLQDNDPTGANAAFLVAAHGGWRDLLTQLYWYDEAMRLGDVDRAAIRADAAWRVFPDLPAARELLVPLEATEAGRAAISRRMGFQPSWSKVYFQVDAKTDPAVIRAKADVALAMPPLHSAVGCNIFQELARGLLRIGERGSAAAIWSANCSESQLAESGLVDGDFSSYATTEEDQPFGWMRYPTADVSVDTVEATPGNWAVEAMNTASVRKIVLSQPLGLSAGTYRLRAKVTSSGRPVTARLEGALACEGVPGRVANVVGDMGRAPGQLLTVESCAQPVLSLWLTGGAGPLMIDDISLVPVR